MKNYQRRGSGIPSLIFEQPAATTTLALKQDSPSPTFAASGNSHAFDLTLDTGAFDLVLGQAQAKSLGVKLFDQSMHVSGVLSKDVPAQRGLLDTLQLGDITLHNVPVTVIPQSIALLGANLVAPLGTLRVSRSSLTISGTKQASSTQTCDTPMLVASDVWGRSLTVVPQLLIDDAPRAVMVDTGAGSYLIGSKQALNDVTTLHRDKSAMNDIGDAYAFASVKKAKVNLTIADQPINMYFDVYSNSDQPWAITLGAGALRDMDFVFDFQHQHICFALHPHLH
jgi:predicted aspartyl protease